MKARWKKIYKKHVLCYEGFAIHRFPYGFGTEFYADGSKYREGIYGFKGLVKGTEYYPNGNIRFEGIFEEWMHYGPNPPVWGRFYSSDGECIYQGESELRYGNVAYPFIVIPESYGEITKYQDEYRPDYFRSMPKPYPLQAWHWLLKAPHRIHIKCFLLWRKLLKKPAVTLEEYTALVKKHYFDDEKMPEWRIKYFYSSEAQKHIEKEYKSDIKEFENKEMSYEALTYGCPSGVAYCLEMMA